VRRRDSRLGAGEGPRQRRVGVAVDEDDVGGDLGDGRLECGQHPRGLRGVGPQRDPELAVGRGQAELLEEHRGQLVVEVLARVDEQFLVALAQPR